MITPCNVQNVPACLPTSEIACAFLHCSSVFALSRQQGPCVCAFVWRTENDVEIVDGVLQLNMQLVPYNSSQLLFVHHARVVQVLVAEARRRKAMFAAPSPAPMVPVGGGIVRLVPAACDARTSGQTSAGGSWSGSIRT